MPPTSLAWLERNYGQPHAFRPPVSEETHTPFGPFQLKPDHPADCLCETGEGEFWLQADTVMKWRTS